MKIKASGGGTKFHPPKNEERNQEQSLTTSQRVYALLKQKHYIASRGFIGDYSASDILLDLERAIESAKLTKRQKEMIEHIFELGLTQQETALKLGIAQNTVSGNLKGALTKIAAVYASWSD